MSGLAEYFQNMQAMDFKKGQALRENLRADENMGLSYAANARNERITDQNIASNKQNMESALQDRIIKATSLFADQVGGAIQIEDPAQYKQALDMVYKSPIARVVDPNNEYRGILEKPENAKQLMPALMGLSALNKQEMDKQKQQVEYAKLVLSAEKIAENNKYRQMKYEMDQEELERQRSKNEPSNEYNKALARKDAKTVNELENTIPKLAITIKDFETTSDEILNDPNLENYLGKINSMKPDISEEANAFRNRLKKITGQAFITQFESLKGGGAITVEEGKAATEALLAINEAQNFQDFARAIYRAEKTLKDIFNSTKKRLSELKQRYSRQEEQPLQQPQNPTSSVQPNNDDPLGLF